MSESLIGTESRMTYDDLSLYSGLYQDYLCWLKTSADHVNAGA